MTIVNPDLRGGFKFNWDYVNKKIFLLFERRNEKIFWKATYFCSFLLNTLSGPLNWWAKKLPFWQSIPAMRSISVQNIW
jgi:hypothetical protein